MRTLLALGAVLLSLASAPTPPAVPLPARMADTGGGSQLITAVAADASATTGTVTWWDRRGRRWVRAGSAPARFGAKGLAEGATRRQGTHTTPTGLFDLPYAFGIRAAPAGTRFRYVRATADSWWCQDNDSRAYNRWVEKLPADCRAAEAEHIVAYGTQYAHALVIGFNYARPVRRRGAGIFLHVNGRGATAGCVSVPADAMRAILAWADPARRPHIAVGTRRGPTAVTRY
ncbi:L,D-transpeptidase family protein [Streptomyces roseofulvus]|uniref:L,D-transpeptidase family protein n=1 Tax=Streptomyces roseofulvus TaxID=33902 RepID=UPI0031F94DF9